jgi:hypothetical protein
VYAELGKAARHNSYIEAYYQSICRHKWQPWRRRTRKKTTCASFKEFIVNGKSRFIGFGINRGRPLEEEVVQLANSFFSEADKYVQARYLMFFRASKFSFDYQPLLKIAREKNPRNTRLVEFALEALQYFSADEIRQ